MTGFGSAAKEIALLGKVSVELRSANHKFLDIVFHLPEELLSLEERMKREIETKIKRGRVTCAINIAASRSPKVYINKPLLKNYLAALKSARAQFRIKNDIGLDTIINLPGVLSLTEDRISKERVWPGLKALISSALEGLDRARQKEGRALCGYLRNRAQALKVSLGVIKERFKKVTKKKIATLLTDEERCNFLKDTDITEEIDRLTFHIRNFKNKLTKAGVVGKELDFIAQEMQREANTIAAKSCDAFISGRVVGIKSQIEKIREQVQNIE
jgi:uncharacterized protein (TIGR00255 family)